jgi:hypothetical protein
MTDILADYLEWAAAQPTRVSTHSDRCHLWHEPCMIHRLARAFERASQNCDSPTLTDAEREAVEAAARIIDDYDEEMDGFSSGAAATLRALLERTK